MVLEKIMKIWARVSLFAFILLFILMIILFWIERAFALLDSILLFVTLLIVWILLCIPLYFFGWAEIKKWTSIYTKIITGLFFVASLNSISKNPSDFKFFLIILIFIIPLFYFGWKDIFYKH